MKINLLSLAISAALLFTLRGDYSQYTIGDKVENFTLRNVDRRMVSLSDYDEAAGIIIVFTCLHCPYAEMYEDRIIQLHKKYAPKGYPVLAINPTSPRLFPEDNFEKMRARAQQKRYPFAYLQDSAQVVLARFAATRTPHVFLLDKSRIVRYMGAIDDNAENPRAVRQRYVENAIDALMRGERPYPDITRAIGCPIRRPKPVPPVDSATASPRR